MNISEIRVGNYLRRKSNGNMCIVNSYMILDIENGEGNDYIPVLLNDELLLAFGFEEYNEDIPFIRYGYRNDSFRVVVDSCGSDFIIRVSDTKTREYVLSKRVCYLHQLQNLVFDLCGHDLQKA